MLNRIQKLRNEQGFTLVELLVVVTILGVLAAVAVIAVGSSQTDSKVSACKTDLATVQAAADAYQAKNGTAAGSIGALSPTFLRTPPPTTNGYVISVSGGTASVAPLLCAVP
jgi:prepilin-type N-terminal cleavage/methylation domain-containing protein